MKLKNFFANFQILGPLGCQGWVVIPQKNVKKVKITAPYCAVNNIDRREGGGREEGRGSGARSKSLNL
jgi:hypothetical protein